MTSYHTIQTDLPALSFQLGLRLGRSFQISRLFRGVDKCGITANLSPAELPAGAGTELGNIRIASWKKTSSNSVKNYSRKILLYNFQKPMDRAIQKCVDFKRLRHINMSKCRNTKGHFFLKRPVPMVTFDYWVER